MRQMVLRMFVSVAFGSLAYSTAFSQGPPPPPPPPLIYEAPDAGDLHRYSAPDGIFQIEFPSKPTVTVRETDGLVTNLYSANRKGSNSLVGVTKVPSGIDLASRSEQVFAALREELGKRAQSKVVRESDIELDGYPGREFEVDYGLQYGLVRVYLVGSMLVEVQSDVTNWHIIGDTTKDSWRRGASRFFGSLKLKQ